MNEVRAYVGLDVHKETIAVAVAEAQRGGEVRFWGNIPNTPTDLQRVTAKLSERHGRVEFIYEAGPCGYHIYRQLTSRGHDCQVIAPSHILRKPGDHVKNDHRDAETLARLGRAGELTRVWVPDPLHEAIRDLVRARHSANRDVKQARQLASELGPIGGRIPPNSRLILHVQPGEGPLSVIPSVLDREALTNLGQRSSVIINSAGTYSIRFGITNVLDNPIIGISR